MDHNRKVVELLLDDVLPNRFQPRIKFNEDSIIELSESIKEHGVIQPIVVRPVGDKYEIIAGERRYKASCMAGLEKIPALVTDLNDKDSAEVALIENVQRKDLTPIEEAISYKKILDMGYLTQEKLAEKLGKKQSTVANKLRLLNLDEDVQEAILEDKISERHARSILKLTNPEDQKRILNKIITERLTVRKTDEEINKMLNGNYEESSKVLQPTEPVKSEIEQDNITPEAPFDFSKLDFLQEQQEEPKNFEIPKFEDILSQEAPIQNLSVDVPENVVQTIEPQNIEGNQVEQEIKPVESFEFEMPEFDIPSFEDFNKDFSQVEESKAEFVKILENNSENVIEPEKEEDLLIEKPTPFVFDSLFIEENDQDVEQNQDVEEFVEGIEFIDELEDAININVNELESNTVETNNNVTKMYVANDFKTVINTIRNCAETIEKYGFKINVEELELPGEYKVTFDIKM